MRPCIKANTSRRREVVGLISKLLFEAVQIPGPSGHEGRVAAWMEVKLSPHVDEVWRDGAGNVVGKKKGKNSQNSLMLAAHMDEVSLVVRSVSDVVRFEVVGWIDPRTLLGSPVLVLARGEDIPGVIRSTSAHLAEAGGEVELWIDTGSRTSDVRIGDPIVFATNPRWLSPDERILASHAIDDRIGLCVLVEVAKKLTEQPECDIYFVATVQEEVGGYGAVFAAGEIKPTWAVAIDTAFASDPALPENPPLDSGPVVRRFVMSQPKGPLYPPSILFSSAPLGDAMMESARKQGLPVNEDINCRTFTDACRIFDAHPDIACLPFLIPRRYSHSPYEVVDVRNADITAQIILGALPLVFAS